jgi:hypothetical protein
MARNVNASLELLKRDELFDDSGVKKFSGYRNARIAEVFTRVFFSFFAFTGEEVLLDKTIDDLSAFTVVIRAEYSAHPITQACKLVQCNLHHRQSTYQSLFLSHILPSCFGFNTI